MSLLSQYDFKDLFNMLVTDSAEAYNKTRYGRKCINWMIEHKFKLDRETMANFLWTAYRDHQGKTRILQHQSLGTGNMMVTRDEDGLIVKIYKLGSGSRKQRLFKTIAIPTNFKLN